MTMKKGFELLKAYGQDDSGGTAIEYGLIAALIGLGVIAGLGALGGNNTGAWDGLSNNVTSILG